MSEIKNLIYDPEAFLITLEEATKEHIGEYMDNRTAEWKARGKDKAVRSSSLGTCIRQSYYGYFSDRQASPITDELARKRMYMGFINEETQAAFLKRMPGKLHNMTTKINYSMYLWN